MICDPQWDAGMATWAHTPYGRGFDTSLIYFHHCNDYWSRTVSNATDGFCSPDSAMVDFWNGTGPAYGANLITVIHLFRICPLYAVLASCEMIFLVPISGRC